MFITVGDSKIYALSFGPQSGPAILALSGWIGTWEDWADPLSILSDSWRTVAYDQRGSGITISPVESITIETLVDDVFTILDAFGIERCILAAMSAGAAVAFRAALKAPERFSGLVIVDGLDLRDGALRGSPFLTALQQDYSGAIEYFVNGCIPEPESDHLKAWGRKILNRAEPEAAIRLLEVVQAVDLRQELPKINQPTLILHGDMDQISPLDSAVWLAETLPDATLKTLKGAGHVPIMTRPIVVAKEIKAFFNDFG